MKHEVISWEAMSGFVKCPLCPVESLRRYAFSETSYEACKFNKHLHRDHPEANMEKALTDCRYSLTEHCAPLLSELNAVTAAANTPMHLQ